MLRTLALRVYPNGNYVNPLNNPSSNHAVRLLYANLVNGIFVEGGVVPGSEFDHVDAGVWERVVDSNYLSANRTDYYYVQYTIKTDGVWGEWVNVAGYDPFYFNMMLSGAYSQIDTNTPTLTPNKPTITASLTAVKITAPTQYIGGTAISPQDIIMLEWVSTSNRDYYDGDGWVGGACSGGQITIYRDGTDFERGKWIHARARVYDQGMAQYSKYSSEADPLELVSVSIEESIDASVENPPYIVAANVTESMTWVVADSITVKTETPKRGIHHEIAVQYGGRPYIGSGILGDFSGVIIETTKSSTTFQKPHTLTGPTTLWVAIRALGYTDASDWVGSDDTSFFGMTISPISIITMMSSDILGGIATYVAAKLITADGQNLEIKQGT